MADTVYTPLKVRALRQILHTLHDDDDLFFVTNDGQEFFVGGALEIPEFNALYFGEDQVGLNEALEELASAAEAQTWEHREDAIDAMEEEEAEDWDNDDIDAQAAPEGSDLPVREPKTCCPLPEPAHTHEDTVLEAM